MIVFMGKYRNHFSVTYNSLTKDFFEKHEKLDSFCDKFIQPVINVFFNSWYTKLSRLTFVHTSNQDAWSADHTLAVIALPLILKIKKNKQGAPLVDNEDVPENLWRDTEKEVYDTDENWFKRWDYVLDEMIFALTALVKEEYENQFYRDEPDTEGKFQKIEPFFVEGDAFYLDKQGLTEYNKRVENGLLLIGKYWQGLWD